MSEFPLQLGSTGARVRDCQWLLSGHGKIRVHTYTGHIDGHFGHLLAQACVEAHRLLGYQQHAWSPQFGQQIYDYLTGTKPLPADYKARRRVALRKAHPSFGIMTAANFAGVDQGTDWYGHGPLVAKGDGEVFRLERTGSGWPGGALICVRYTTGIFAHLNEYNAENLIIPARLKVGSHVKEYDVLATSRGVYPYCEVGLCDYPGGHPLAGIPPKGQPTAEGARYYALVRKWWASG
jgi:hypothetical protein